MIIDTGSYTVLHTGTHRGDYVYALGSKYEANGLFEVYNNPSALKRMAYEMTVREFYDDKSARNYRICSHNVQRFTVAWDTSAQDPKTGEIKAARVVKTGINNYLVFDE